MWAATQHQGAKAFEQTAAKGMASSVCASNVIEIIAKLLAAHWSAVSTSLRGQSVRVGTMRREEKNLPERRAAGVHRSH
jgi:hypothetical protein